jgi:transposase-like protein
MNDYVNTLHPKLSGKIEVDGQKVKSKGDLIWSWNAIDEETRFLVANNITDSRGVNDASEVFQKIKEASTEQPIQIKTDELWSYEKAINKEFVTHKDRRKTLNHIRNVGISKDSNNNIIERYHNGFRVQ